MISTSILVWNVRGLNSEDRQRSVRAKIEEIQCYVICLQETKKPSFDNMFLKSCCPRRFDKFAYIPSRGASGGIVTIWNSALFTGTVMIEEEFALVIKFKSTQSAQE